MLHSPTLCDQVGRSLPATSARARGERRRGSHVAFHGARPARSLALPCTVHTGGGRPRGSSPAVAPRCESQRGAAIPHRLSPPVAACRLAVTAPPSATVACDTSGSDPQRTLSIGTSLWAGRGGVTTVAAGGARRWGHASRRRSKAGAGGGRPVGGRSVSRPHLSRSHPRRKRVTRRLPHPLPPPPQCTRGSERCLKGVRVGAPPASGVGVWVKAPPDSLPPRGA